MAYTKTISPGRYSEYDVFGLIDSLRTVNKIPSGMDNTIAIETVLAIIVNDPTTWDEVYSWVNLYFTEIHEDVVAEQMLGLAQDTPTAIRKQLEDNQKSIFANVWADLGTYIVKFAKDVWNWLAEDVLGMTKENFEGFLSKMITKGIIDEESRAGIADMINTFPKGHTWMYISTFLAIFKTFMAVNISAIGGTLMKRLNRVHTPNTPAPNAVIRAAFLDPALQARVRTAMAENGLSEADQDLMFAAQYFTFDLQTIAELRLRDFIDDTRMNKYMDDMALTPERRADFIKLMQRLPPLGDIATMMAKEAFEPNMVAMMGLHLELPGQFVKYAGQHGLSEEWAEHYWAAHWQQPGLEMMFDAFHRRIVNEDFLKQFMKVVEIPPYLRDILLQVAYMPLTRVDIRRMYSDGILDVEEVYSAYLDHGYSPLNARLMTEWTIRYAEPNEKELSRSQIVSLYIDGQVSRADALLMLVKIGYPTHRAELLMVYAEYDEIKDLQTEQLKNVEQLYKGNWIDAAKARSEMSNLEVGPERISILIQKWNIPKAVATKAPSKTDLDKFVRNEIIDEGIYRNEMSRAGYSVKYIDWFWSLLNKGE